MKKLILIALLSFTMGVLMYAFADYTQDQQIKKELAFVKEANAYKYECLIAADMYITANEHLLEYIEDDPNICFADTYGELDCVYEMDRAYERLDSLAATQL